MSKVSLRGQYKAYSLGIITNSRGVANELSNWNFTSWVCVESSLRIRAFKLMGRVHELLTNITDNEQKFMDTHYCTFKNYSSPSGFLIDEFRILRMDRSVAFRVIPDHGDKSASMWCGGPALTDKNYSKLLTKYWRQSLVIFNEGAL